MNNHKTCDHRRLIFFSIKSIARNKNKAINVINELNLTHSKVLLTEHAYTRSIDHTNEAIH